MTVAKPREFKTPQVPDDVFSLPPAAFVEAWAAALALDERDLSKADRDSLLGALRSGTNRLKVIDALERRRAAPHQSFRVASAHSIRRAPDGFALVETFTRFAPDDDAAFLRHAFSRICDRGPGEMERLELEFDLRRGLVDRSGAVKRIVAIAASEGRGALWDSLETDNDTDAQPRDPTSARTMPVGLTYDENGRETLIFVRDVPGAGIVTAPDVLRQAPRAVDVGWAVQEGWLVVGPKRSFAPGRWRVDLDLLQPEGAIVDLDVVANSGLDVLQHIVICGPFLGSFCVEFRHEHRFSELRLAVRRNDAGNLWIRPRNISMQRVA